MEPVAHLSVCLFSHFSVLRLLYHSQNQSPSVNISQMGLEKSNVNGMIFTLVLLFFVVDGAASLLELDVAAPQEAWSSSSKYTSFVTELSGPSC